MKLLLLPLAALAAAPFFPTATAPPQEDEIAAAMAKVEALLKPSDKHDILGKLVGAWKTTSRVTMGGATGDPSPGRSVFSWKEEGRWLEGSYEGVLMGFPMRQHMWLGYDNFKQSYVWTDINSMDTAMKHAEGDMTPDGKTLILYGTLDEYLTGEHDKMVKYVWRFRSDDEFVLEVHDLPIGEFDTKVLEFRYTREK
jgi:hypothetical protein